MREVSEPRLRLAVVGTPRSGNTWIRGLLAGLFGLEQIGAHFPEDVAWDRLPNRCVLQIHWHPTVPFVSELERHGFRVVVPARHPFDVLMSWLNYAFYDHLEGYCPKVDCDKCAIVGVTPRSDAFRTYVTGGMGHWLLGYSPAWWDRPGVIRVRYEELVAEPEAALARLADAIGEPPRGPTRDVVESSAIPRMKASPAVWQYHYWKGQPGLWRSLLPADDARVMAASVPGPFAVLGYACDPDESLDAVTADQNWLRLQLDSAREHLTLGRAKAKQKADEFAALQAELAQSRQTLADERREHAETRRLLDEALASLDPADARPCPAGEGGRRVPRFGLTTRRILGGLRSAARRRGV